AVHYGTARGDGVAAALAVTTAPVGTTPTSAPVATAGPTDFVAHLADGTTVELFGVNENPSDGPGWRADGSPLEGQPFVTGRPAPADGSAVIEIGLRFTGRGA